MPHRRRPFDAPLCAFTKSSATSLSSSASAFARNYSTKAAATRAADGARDIALKVIPKRARSEIRVRQGLDHPVDQGTMPIALQVE